jgi:hypothetical protein
LGALPELPEVGPDVEPPAPGIAPTPGAPEVAVPTDPAPDVDGLSAWFVMERSALPDALAFDLEEDLPDEEEEPASFDVVPCAWAYEPKPIAAAETRTRVIRENSGFMVISNRWVIRAPHSSGADCGTRVATRTEKIRRLSAFQVPSLAYRRIEAVMDVTR